jgi:hypothetical protein
MGRLTSATLISNAGPLLPASGLQPLAYSNAMRVLGAFLAVVAVAVLAVLAWLWMFGA